MLNFLLYCVQEVVFVCFDGNRVKIHKRIRKFHPKQTETEKHTTLQILEDGSSLLCVCVCVLDECVESEGRVGKDEKQV